MPQSTFSIKKNVLFEYVVKSEIITHRESVRWKTGRGDILFDKSNSFDRDGRQRKQGQREWAASAL